MTWVRRNLFANVRQTLLTFTFGAIAFFVVYRFVRFVFITGRWEIIRVKLNLLLIGRFPRSEQWRVWAAAFLLTAALAALAGAVRARAITHGERPGSTGPVRRAWPVALLVVTLLSLRPSIGSAGLALGIAGAAIAFFRIGRSLGAARFRETAIACLLVVLAAYAVVVVGGGIRPEDWGGFMLTLALASAGILLSFPVGILLALGRRSTLPAVRVVCTAYIEIIRGVPLVTVLFMATLLVGFLLPRGAPRPSLVTRAIVAFVAFTAAYVAEIVRGGLEAVGRGQVDAATALGLGPVSTLRFIVLPQALRAVIPGLVGQFITLFKDTSLVTIISLTELLRTAQIITRDPDFLAQGLHAETLAFAAFVYWTISYTMSRESQRLEQRLGVGVR